MDLARETVALVLAGGNGTRLGELTRWQCKPAVSFGGHLRNIDFTLSNCVNSGVRRVAVLTQYKAQSLISHVGAGWSFLARPLGEFIDVWPAQQRLHTSWYAGTADAVHQNLDLLLIQRSRYTLVLAGDHVYKMNYRLLLEQHARSGADVTVACVPVPVEESASFGVLGMDERRRVRSFIEKPQPAGLGLAGQRTVLASMGVYVFNTGYLERQLKRDAGRTQHHRHTTLVATSCRERSARIMLQRSPSWMRTGNPAIGVMWARWTLTGRLTWSCSRRLRPSSCSTPPGPSSPCPSNYLPHV